MTEDTKVTTLDDGNDNEAVDTTTTAATTTKGKGKTVAKTASAAPAPADAEVAALVADGEIGHIGRCLVTVHADKGEGGNQAVFVSVNGQAFQIPRGKPVDVPLEVAQALENAVETIYDGGGAGREAPRYAVTIKHL